MRPLSLLLFLTIAATVFGPWPSSAAQGCPDVSGYSFYQRQEVLGAHRLASLPSPDTPANLKAACDATPRCNAFTTSGSLLTVPMVPAFSVLDGSDPELQECDGVYLVAEAWTLTGLVLPDGEDEVTLRQAGSRAARDLQATQAAAEKVAAKLLERSIRPNSARDVRREDLTAAFRDARTPLAQSSDAIGSYTFGDVMAALSYPVWDSRTANGTSYNYISTVKNQRSCGSCVSFAATAAAETAVAIGNGTVVNTNDLSEQWLFFCNGKYYPSCSTGWTATQAVDVLSLKGIPAEANYPYLSAPGCTLNSPPERRPGGKFSWVSYTNLTLAKEHIRKYGSMLSYLTVYNDFFYWTATSKPYSWDRVSPLAGYHQVLTIGYNDTGSYWIVKNSWGTGWGDRGFFRISYTAGVGFMSGARGNMLGLIWTRTNVSSPANTTSPSPSPSLIQSASPSPSLSAASACGDSVCSADETCASCPSDCGVCTECGDGVCTGGETCSTCPSDCGYLQPNGSRTCCGDGICSAAAGETCSSCPSDCGTCATCNNNGVCEPELGEACSNGATSGCADCGSCSGSYCGDGKCSSSKQGYSETCGTCPQDCGRCLDVQFCGDGLCSSSRAESPASCPRDCSPARFVRVAPGSSSSSGGQQGGGGAGRGNQGNGKAQGKLNGRAGTRRALRGTAVVLASNEGQ